MMLKLERLSLQPLILPMRMLLRIMMRFNLPELTEGAQLRAIAFANMPEISLAGTTIDNFVSPVYTMPAAGFAEKLFTNE